MSTSMTAAVEAYRAEAALRFANASSATPQHPVVNKPNEPCQPIAPAYRRDKIPGLDQYLQRAAKAYIHRNISIQTNRHRPRACALGSGHPVLHLYAHVRRRRWLVARAVHAHRVAAPASLLLHDIVTPCRIPRDILAAFATRFLEYRTRRSAFIHLSKPDACKLGTRASDDSIHISAICKCPEYLIHIERCASILKASGTFLLGKLAQASKPTIDSVDDVRRRYAGRPDELYKRKTARKYAIWRRRQREFRHAKQARASTAENEMKRRRGHDLLLTSRPTGDSSFAPFLYELDNNAYAYSSKISDAPKLRKVMIDRYSDCELMRKQVPEPTKWEKAHQAAESNPLFHTRVMNRFS